MTDAWFVLDFETVSACDLKKAGAYRYAEDPTTSVLCCSFAWEDGTVETWFPGQPPIQRVVQAIADGAIAIAHNAQFEREHWRLHMVPVGWPEIPQRQWHDTMARAATLMLPQALDKCGRALGLQANKDMEGSRLTKGLSRPNRKGYYPEITPAVLERVGVYCEGDVIEQRELHQRIGWLPPDERAIWLHDQVINQRGLRLDIPLIENMRRIVDAASVPLADRFREITGVNMTQRDKVLSWLLDQGVMLPDMKKETLAAVLGETDEGEEVDEDDRLVLDLPPHVREALHIRQLIGSASIKKLGAMEACVCADGRARGLLAYAAAGTLRWAGRLLQPQNFPRGSDEIQTSLTIDDKLAALATGDPEMVKLMTGFEPVELVVASLRHAVVADPDKYFVAGDYAGIEARMVLALAGQHDKTELMASGADVYCDMASQIYGHEVNKKDHPEKRQIGKNSVLGLGFQMGAPKFQARYGEGQPLEFFKTVVETYRKSWAPMVPKLWEAQENAAREAVWTGRPHEGGHVLYQMVDRWLVAEYIDGSHMWYLDPRPVRRAMPWDETDVRRSWTYKAVKQGRLTTIDAYGGLLSENAAQHMARQLLARAMRMMEKERLPVVLSVHDEAMAEVEKSRQDAELVVQQVMRDRPDWAKRINLPVAVETWAGDRYRK